ncbi:four-carbon acid sugar kinase family protein [Fontivita pretiosa]|uniref:four-carbon acid sugar kinase family protein n=1 Tax=Fontivita pretiosa TaxID=2989684 RepID=UPI003D175F3C
MNDLLISFYGDDFTGSTDAMESLALAGLRTVLFTAPPNHAQLARYPGLRAYGVAGMTRSMTPDQMEATLRPVFGAMKSSGAPIVHYKVCSTFDSSPTVGSIGRVIDVGAEVFGMTCVPVLVGAPSLGRYCVFGNLFARCGAESEPYRLDRHPSMSRHPITPMDEADLRLHLAKQTRRRIGLFDVLNIERTDAVEMFDRARSGGNEVLLIDVLYERQLATVGSLIERFDKPMFVVGSSGVESALCAHWQQSGRIDGQRPFDPPGHAGPIVAVCGSCSPVTAGQIRHAIEHDFVEVSDLSDRARAAAQAAAALRIGRSVVIHSRQIDPAMAVMVGPTLGGILRQVLAGTNVRRVLVAGGDTSGQVAQALGIESMEMIAELTRGSPLCRVTAPGSPADGIQITFKGGQIGKQNFFTFVRDGKD